MIQGISNRLRTAVLFAFGIMLMASSCDNRSEGTVSLSSSKVDLGKGSVFISIVSEHTWEVWVAYEGEQKDWIRINRTSGSGNTNSVILSYSRNDADDSRHAVITVRFPKSEASVRFTQTGLSAVISDAPRGWMELPATDTEKEGFTWSWHDMTVASNRTMRNYSFYFSHEDAVSHWIAYPLNQGLIGSGSRTDVWAYDPKLPQDIQGYVGDGKGGEGYYRGYARGHQLPSADRLRRLANEQTFYSTNIVPQMSSFNGGVWLQLESKVRAWMSSFDTLYVVTGCVPSQDDFATDAKGKRVNVPEAFYKALLGYKASASPKDRYAGVAFYLEHDTPRDAQLKSVAVSISELEKKLDMNFFVNLPDEYSGIESVVSDKFTIN